MSENLTVGRVADHAGVTVRTLHHYDKIGLVCPSGRSESGYRTYDAGDIQRLQQVLLYRGLGFSLEEIAALVDNPATDTIEHLQRQRTLLQERGAGIAEMLAAVDAQLAAYQSGVRLTPAEQLEVFGTEKIGQWAAEAEQEWGETDSYRESQRRTSQHSKADWIDLKSESDQGLRDFAAALRSGKQPTETGSMDLAEEHRQFLIRWFYPCDYTRHVALAQMYIDDARFTATFEDVAPGLAQFVHDAIVANADARGSNS